MFIPIAIAAGLAGLAAPAGWGLGSLVARVDARGVRLAVFAGLLVLSLLPLTMHFYAGVQSSLWGLQEIATSPERYGDATLRASRRTLLRYAWGVLVGGLVLVAAGVAAAVRGPVLGALTPSVALGLYLMATRWYQDAVLRRDGALIGDGDVAMHFLAGNVDLMVLLLTGVTQVGLFAFAWRTQFGGTLRLPFPVQQTP
jgi:hypothetical protein